MIPYTAEQSQHDHINTFFANYKNVMNTSLPNPMTPEQNYAAMRETLQAVQNLGGLSRINHPGRYTGAGSPGVNSGTYTAAGANISNDPKQIEKYVSLFMEFSSDSLVGMEIINKQDGDSVCDRILWDNILTQTLTQGENSRNIWGFADDDFHGNGATVATDNVLGSSFNMFLMPELTIEAFREAMVNGTFYAVAKIARHEMGIASGEKPNTTQGSASLTIPTPVITEFVADPTSSTVTMSTENVNRIDWVSEGKVIGTGETLEVLNNPNVGVYVRANAVGTGGVAFTQAIVTGFDRAVSGAGSQTTFDGVVQSGASYLANTANRTNVVINSQHIVGDYLYDAYVMHNGGTIGNADILFGTLANNATLTNATVSENGTLINYITRTIGTVNVGVGGYVANEGTVNGTVGTVNKLTMTGGTFFNDRGMVGTSTGTTSIGGTGWLYNAAGTVRGNVEVSGYGVFENSYSKSTAITSVIVSDHGMVHNYGTSSIITSLTMSSDSIVRNGAGGRINNLTYYGGTYLDNVDDKYTNFGTGTIDTLTLAGDASGVDDWGKVGNLKFDGNGAGVIIVSAFADGVDSSYSGIKATSANFSGGNVVLDLSSVEGIFGEDYWADVFFGAFGYDDGFYLSTLVGASAASGVGDLISLEVAWGNDSFSILNEGVFGAGWDIDFGTGFVSYRSMS